MHGLGCHYYCFAVISVAVVVRRPPSHHAPYATPTAPLITHPCPHLSPPLAVASPHTAAATAALASADPSGTSPRPVQLREREREVVSHVRAMAFVEMCFVPCRK